jgi:hypothetical protein
MKFRSSELKKHLILTILTTVLLFATGASSVMAADTGKLITNQCRQNLKMLNEVMKKHVEKNNELLPPWANYATVKSSMLSFDDLPQDPVAPTPDCKYNLISNSRDDFQWYCTLHGVLEGEKTVTFQYHEHRIMAKTSSRYMNNQRYKDHNSDLLRWTEYAPTPVERFKYHYNMNPLSTILLLSGALVVLVIVYRSL